MVRIRLRRVGAKKQPSFRVVAANKESPRDGRFIENLGHYNPRTEPATISLKEDRIFDWMMKGAQPSDAVMQIFTTVGLLERFERFKAGEDIDVLLEEAATAEADRNIDPRTKREAKQKPKVKVQEPAKAEEAVEDSEPEETPEAGETADTEA